jgi:hypothetical protein
MSAYSPGLAALFCYQGTSEKYYVKVFYHSQRNTWKGSMYNLGPKTGCMAKKPYSLLSLVHARAELRMGSREES